MEEIFSWIEAIVTMVAVFVVVKLFVDYFSEIEWLQAGPYAWPVIGSLHLIGKLPHQSLHRMAQKYGPLMYLKLGTIPTIVVSNSGLAKEVLKNQTHVFANRPPNIAAKIITYGQDSIVSAEMSENWKLMRRISQSELLSPSRLSSFEVVRRDEVLGTVREILEECKGGGTVELAKKLSGQAMNNITRMIFSKKYFGPGSEISREAVEMKEAIPALIEAMGKILPGQCIPALRWLDIGGHEANVRKVFKAMDTFLSASLKEHRNNQVAGDVNQVRDCIDVLLDDSRSESLSDNAIKAFLNEIIVGASDTSASLATWTMAELMKHPAMMERAQDELSLVVGPRRLVEESDIAKLCYLQAVVKETFRLHPLIPYATRIASEATTLAGCHVAKGTSVFVNFYAIHRDPFTWVRPTEFDPSRHSGNVRTDTSGQDFSTVIPFGGGKRLCPGRNLGFIMVHFTLAQLLHTCNWALPEGQTPEDVDLAERPGVVVTLRNPLNLAASLRLPLLEKLLVQY